MNTDKSIAVFGDTHGHLRRMFQLCRLIRETVQALQPTFQVFGHHSRPIPRTSIGRTECVWLNDTNFSKTRDGIYNGQ